MGTTLGIRPPKGMKFLVDLAAGGEPGREMGVHGQVPGRADGSWSLDVGGGGEGRKTLCTTSSFPLNFDIKNAASSEPVSVSSCVILSK